jgi:hypothetical protein
MLLNKVEDHRDCLEKATRWELFQFASERGVTEIDQKMPAILMRQILRARNVTNIETQFPFLTRRTIGQQRGVNATNPQNNPNAKVAEIDATQELMRQWRNEQARDVQPPIVEQAKRAVNPMAELRAECKRRGIKITRTSKMEDLRAKIDGENSA